MSEVVISVENLSKKFLIRHQAETHHRYTALRDVIAEKAASLFKPGGAGETAEEFWALSDVQFQIKDGECVGIIGRNGAGKSTLLKLLSRITEPTRGCIRLRGRVASLLEVGTGFHPELTGRENIFLNGAILGMSRADIVKRFDEIVAFAEVEKFLDTPVKRFSSGMYMRLAFSVAAHLEPDILIVDEVLAVGDASFQKKCMDKMEDTGKSGRTVLFVSHSMPSITRLCQRALLLENGRLTADGPASEVVGRYLSGGTHSNAVREWPADASAPGNGMVRIRAVRVFDARSGQIAENIDIRHPVEIEVEYENQPNGQFPYANVQLYNDAGVCLFASGDYTNLDWRHAPRKFRGRVTSRCRIPGNFLAEGRFRVLVGLTTHTPHEILALARDAVSFMIVDNSHGDGARGEYEGPVPGVMRPLLEWKVRHEEL